MVIYLVRKAAVAWVVFAAAPIAVILIGQWHSRHARRDSAVGAFAGAVLWPVLGGFALVAVNLAAAGLSDHE
ncbi:hypothetical protein [Actinoplanes sp. DH11]|uniref:hypothetical protein n=1 Tax=Actinoplanes sp. DH11 TaxID=2857011 RepID=UPI001E306FC5|nr:hypothetical protein [Actinoplanes sp. DH11]